MNTYSQYAEDLHAWEILGRHKVTAGRVLEIGAWNPIDKSNSRSFIEAGWEAVLIEPSPKPLADCAREYWHNERVTVIGSPVTVEGGIIEMNLTDDALSSQVIQPQWSGFGWYGKIKMLSISLQDLFIHIGGNFEVISFDVEGQSCDLFFAMLKGGVRPRVVILEHDNRLVELHAIAQEAGYRQAHLNGTNCVLEWGQA